MKIRILALLSLFLFLECFLFAQKKVHLIGDSTMAEHDSATEGIQGWGYIFHEYFSKDISINNRAKSGASSKSYYLESPYWSTVKDQIQAGDYVIIQFGHNDEKNGGLDGDTVRATTDPEADYRGTTAQGTYKYYIRAYVNETRALGGIPILATPICRKYFTGKTISLRGQHDLGEYFDADEEDYTYSYPFAMKEIAEELDVKLLDMTELSKALYEAYGDIACTNYLFGENDGTHTSAIGAFLIGRLCAREMKNQNILSEYIRLSEYFEAYPNSMDFGEVYVNKKKQKKFGISAFDLVPTNGFVNISVSNNFGVSLDGSDFSSSLDIDYTNGDIPFQSFYVTPFGQTAGLEEGTLTVTTEDVTKTIPLLASFVDLVNGTEVKLFWELSSSSEYELVGPAKAIDQSWSEMYVNRYAQPNSNTTTESENWDISRKMQRNLIEGDEWPDGDKQVVSTRYIEFGISPDRRTKLIIDSIGMFIAGSGGSGMKCSIQYSKDNFSTYELIQNFNSMAANNVYAVSSILREVMFYKDTLKIRVYPWYNNLAAGKTLCLSDVCIHGIVTTDTKVNDNSNGDIRYLISSQAITVQNIPNNSTIQMYDIQGKKVYKKDNISNSYTFNKPEQRGIYICVIKSRNSIKKHKILIQ